MIGPRPSDPTPQASAAICAYRPCSVSEAAGAFARQVVAEAAPERAARARALLFAASRLAAFGESVGLELEAEVLLHPAVIERFILAAPETLSPASVRTLRTNLRSLARALQAHPQPAPVALARERAKEPYSEAQIAAYLTCAQAQSTLSRRMRASALICLGAGSGLVGSELRHVRGVDVLERSGGVLVAVAGRRARAVPVLLRFHEPLLAAADFAREDYLLGGKNPNRKNLTCEIAALLCDRSLPRLDTGRLRSTWLTGAAQLIGLHAFMAAAGVRCSQRLGDIAACLPDPGESEMVRLLGGTP
jgi:integrase